MKRWWTDDRHFFLSQISGHKTQRSTTKHCEYRRKGVTKNCCTNRRQLAAIKSELCEHLATGFTVALEMILVTLVLPRSRFPMTVHHNKDLTCSVRVVDIGEERGLILIFACLLSLCPWPVLTVCDHGQGVALSDRLSHTASSSFTRRPHSWSWTARVHRVVYRPAGRELEHRASQFLSLSLNVGQCARGWSPAHESKASYVEAVHELHQQ